MAGRFVRGLMWGGLLGAALGAYMLSGGRNGSRRWTWARGGRGGEVAAREPGVRPSRWRLALDAGRAAMDATLALLGRRA
ncbi:MAG TPA: hypothetical protein VIL11_02530 [Limnochordales bacterium]